MAEVSDDGHRTWSQHFFESTRDRLPQRPPDAQLSEDWSPAAVLEDEDDILEYATSGNFNYTDFGPQSFHEDRDTEAKGRAKKLSRVEGVTTPL